MKNRFAFIAAAGLAIASGAAMADLSAMHLLYPLDSSNPTGAGAGGGWSQSMSPNDDGSTGEIALGFDFCFYESNKNSVFINNNGNISFDSSYSNYTSTGFPVSGFPMIAPFWADVDTRNRDGANTNLVWHKSVDTDGNGSPDVFVVTWDAVGFYSGNNSRLNTFQVAISANESMWGVGKNAAFSYGDMNWTAGSASGGSGGLGGVAATVGINNGNGSDYDQLGRFDHAGNDYHGNGIDGQTSGVDWLDGSTVYLDACQGVVPAPGTAALLGLGGLVAGRRRRA